MMRFFTQEKIHGKFKHVKIIQEKCIKCKKCISVCPVNMFEFSDGSIVMNPENSRCILCAECFHNCPAEAIDHPYIERARKLLKDGYAHLEEVPSAIYPTVLEMR
jgi:NAD-dependent dihydropyrimidine dehydrogenase PreA subunit